MTAVLRVKLGFSSLQWVQLADWNDRVSLWMFEGSWHHFSRLCSHLNIQDGAHCLRWPPLCMLTRFWSQKNISLAQFEWYWCPFACFKGYWKYWFRLFSPPYCHFSIYGARLWHPIPCVESHSACPLPFGVVLGLDVGLVTAIPIHLLRNSLGFAGFVKLRLLVSCCRN